MIGLGTIINTAAIVAGGVLGTLFGNKMKDSYQDSLRNACGVSVLFMSVASAMEIMLTIKGRSLASGRAMFITVCLTLGALIGEIINIELGFEKFGEWLKKKSGNGGDNNFVNAFLTASFTVCIGAMAIVGSIKDGISGDYSVLLVKSVLDFVIIIVLTCSMGKGAAFSAIPVLVLEGGITLFAKLIKPLLTDSVMINISLVGSVLIFCVGINLIWGKKIKVANFLPALIIAVVAALPVFARLPFMK